VNVQPEDPPAGRLYTSFVSFFGGGGGAFGKCRKATVSFLMYLCLSVHPSVCLCVCSQGTTLLPVDGLPLYFIFFNLSTKFKFDSDMTRMMGALNECLCTFMISSSGQKLGEGMLHFRLKVALNVQAIKTVKIKLIHELTQTQ